MRNWSEFSDNCDSCWRAYNATPQGEPCYQHKGKTFDHGAPITTHQEEDEPRQVFGYLWREDEPAHDFSNEPVLLNKLGFLKFLYPRRGYADRIDSA